MTTTPRLVGPQNGDDDLILVHRALALTPEGFVLARFAHDGGATCSPSLQQLIEVPAGRARSQIPFPDLFFFRLL